MNGDGSGRRLPRGWRARMLRSRPACRRLSEPDGSERQAACHQRCSDLRRSRSPGGISRLRSVRRSRFFACRAIRCGRSRRRLGRSASTISRELRRNAATRSGGLEYRATTAQWHAERSARRPKPAKLALNAALRTYVEERLAGIVVAPSGAPVPGPAVSWKGRRHGPAARIDDGPRPGARSRSPGACRSTFRTTRRCASATKPSIKHSSSKAEARCAAN